MESLYQAYQAYERRVLRGEFSTRRARHLHIQTAFGEPVLSKIGDLLIRTGLRMKRRYATGKPLAWSHMTGSKP
jgi:hypothetical protein